MSDFDGQFDSSDFAADEALDLLRVDHVPDLSGRIMNRLGYVRAIDEVVRRRRIRHGAVRAGVCMVMLSMVVVAFQARGQRSDARTPVEVTLPSAVDQVGHDVTLQRERLGRLLQHIQVLPPAGPPAATEPDEEESMDMPSLDDEVNQSGLLPYKWV